MSRSVPGAERIFLRKDGRRCRVVTAPDGRRVWIYGRTRQEVQDKTQALLEEWGLGLQPSTVTVSQYLQSWLRDTVRRYNRPDTYKHYETAVRLFISPKPIGRIPLKGITSSHVEKWIASLTDSGVSPQRIASVRAVLSIALNKAVREQLTRRNPVPGTKMPEMPPPRRRSLSPQEWALFYDQVQGHRLEALYVLAVTTGLRLSEALGLRWQDLDLASRTMVVSAQLHYTSGRGHSLTEPKTQSGRRVVILPAIAVQAIRDHWVRQTKERSEAGEEWDSTWGLVFCTPMGRPIYANNVARWTRKLAKAAGLEGLRFHDLRHTYANLLRSRSVDIKAVSELLGHASSSFTLAVYGHAQMAEKVAAAQVIDASLG